ncbi:MAG: hypothetical protein ACO4AU_12480 [bacterium]
MKKNLISLAVLLLLSTASVRAQSLEVVFKDGLWGAGIGATIMLASWSLSEDQKSDDLQKGLVRGASIGLLVGVAYGLYEVNSGNSLFGQNAPEPPPSLLAYDARAHRLELRPVLPQLTQSEPSGWSWSVFQARF